jgi:hypothetical protein
MVKKNRFVPLMQLEKFPNPKIATVENISSKDDIMYVFTVIFAI